MAERVIVGGNKAMTGGAVPETRHLVKYSLLGCSLSCRLNPQNLPPGVGEMVHKWLEERSTNLSIIKRAAEMGVKLSNGSVGRHRTNHLHTDGSVFSQDEDAPDLSHLEVIERVIQRGAKQANLATTKVTTEQLLHAIELHNKLTAGSVFDDMYAKMQGDLGPDDAALEDIAETEAPVAIRSDEEAAQAGSA